MRALALLLVSAVASACASSSAPATADASALVTLADGAWSLRVDRVWNHHNGPGSPFDDLSEADYEPVAGGPTYAVVVGSGATTVAITPDADAGAPLTGARADAGDGARFDFTGGTFAGGRFVVRAAGAGLDAEFTMYGSGVPIVSSERGPLVRVP